MSIQIYISGGYATEATQQQVLSALGGGALATEQLIFHDHSVTSVTVAYQAIGVATASAVTTLDIFDSSGEPLILGVDTAGGAAFVDLYYIAPGGNGAVKIDIPSGSTLGVRRQAVTGGLDTSAGFLQITALG